MHFIDFKCQIWEDEWHLIPTIVLYFDDPRWKLKNFTLAIHFLCVHMRWFWSQER